MMAQMDVVSPAPQYRPPFGGCLVYQHGIHAFECKFEDVGTRAIKAFAWSGKRWELQEVDWDEIANLRAFLSSPDLPCEIDGALWKKLQFTKAVSQAMSMFRLYTTKGGEQANMELAMYFKPYPLHGPVTK